MARVLIVGDPHCPGMLRQYPSFLQRTYQEYECDRVVLIGDVIDNAAISFHEKAPSLSSAKQEMTKAKRQVSRLYELFPEADWLFGNHDALTERQATCAGILPEYLRDYTQIFNTPGWTVHPRFTRLKIDGVIYTHGDLGKGGMYAAVKNSRDNFISWVQGHCHSEAGVWWTTVEGRSVFGLNVGCGIDRDLLQFNYGRKFNRKPVLGCGVVIDGKLPHFIPMR